MIVGPQWPGFLWRVTSSAAQGATLVVQTTAAALTDVIESGTIATRVSLLFAPAATRRSSPTWRRA